MYPKAVHWAQATVAKIQGLCFQEHVQWNRASMDVSLSTLWEMVKTDRPGELQSIGLQRVGHDWGME